MAAPVYATDLTTFWLEGATTVTSIGSGGAALGNPETDFFIQSAGCISKGAWTNAIKGFIIDALATTFTVPTDGCVIGFCKYDAQGSLDTQAGGGLRFLVGSGSGAYEEYFCAGSDTIAFDSWIPYVVDPNTATSDRTVGSPSGSERWVGVVADLPTSSGPTKGNPIGMDAIRYGRGRIDYTVGDSGDPATFAGAESTGNVLATRWGLLELQKGAFQTQGFHSIGTSGTAVHFDDSNKILFWRKQENNLTNDAISTGFNRVEVINASSVCNWDNVIWSALGTRSRGVFIHTAGTVSLTNCQFYDWNTFSLLAAATATGCIWSRCNAVTAPASTLSNSSILAPTVAAGSAGLIYNSATDTDGKLDNMTFSQGTNAHSAIEFGTSVTASITIRGCDFTGFGSTDDVNGAVFKFLATSGSINLNLVGCTTDGTFSVDDTAGITVTVVQDPVTTEITVTDQANPPVVIENARVFIETSSGAGPLPFEDAVTITQTAGTATVAHTAHGLVTGNYVVIRGATQNGYNKVASITVTTANAYTYAVDSGTVSPATGSPVCSGVIISGLTNASGIVSDTRTFGSNQPFKGWARKSSGSPYYQNGSIAGTISSTAGFSASIALASDE